MIRTAHHPRPPPRIVGATQRRARAHVRISRTFLQGAAGNCRGSRRVGRRIAPPVRCEGLIPCDYRLYAKEADGLTKNDHFRAMLAAAKGRGFAPACVVFDSWYASLPKLKAVRGHGWRWVIQLKRNRLVNPDGTGNRPLGDCTIAEGGTRVHLQGYGFILVFLIVAPDGDREYWATSDLGTGALARRKYAEFAWCIEVYHRGLKQHCGVERAQVRAARAQRNHVTCALRAFLRLEARRLATGVSWWEAKAAIIRDAIRAYLAAPTYTLAPTV